MATRLKTVLIVHSLVVSADEALFARIRLRCAERGLSPLFAECHRRDDGKIHLWRSPRPAESPQMLVEVLRPKGLLFVRDVFSFAEAREMAGPNVPVVFVDRSPDIGSEAAAPAGFVLSDNRDIAARAAQILIGSGRNDFGYVPFLDEDKVWSHERGQEFERLVRAAGKRFHRFRRPSASASPTVLSDALSHWLESLPKPCGVFIANDMVGESVLGLCAWAGLRVPEDIALVGADNNLSICEAASPTLSSIACDFLANCLAGVALLADLIENRIQPPAVRAVPAVGVVQRSSSRFLRDRRVAAAQEFIRLHACDEGFGPPDVVKHMGLSRAYAFTLFRTATGRTILDEIHDVRLARAKGLLAEGTAPDFVSAACGYASHADFRRVFKRRMGVTVRAWTIAHRMGANP